jgi:hypothetical protein
LSNPLQLDSADARRHHPPGDHTFSIHGCEAVLTFYRQLVIIDHDQWANGVEGGAIFWPYRSDSDSAADVGWAQAQSETGLSFRLVRLV